MLQQSIAGLSLCELEQLLKPLPSFRAKQINKWILKGVSSFDQMTDIPVSMQKDLADRFKIFSSSVVSCHKEKETTKIVIALKDKAKIESVLMSDGKKRLTACLSTQAGCPAGCIFCRTGSLGFKRNLDSSEIIEQFLHLKNFLYEDFSQRHGSTETRSKDECIPVIDNIVIMGMGEPLLNLENLRKAISIFTNEMNISKRRITVSTCGICEGLFDIAKKGPFIRLALSLTTADEHLRQKLMPITRTNPLKKIKEALILFQKNSGSRITLEIPLLGGINTREKDALSIAEFAKGLSVVINIIPWNPVAELKFEGKPLNLSSATGFQGII